MTCGAGLGETGFRCHLPCSSWVILGKSGNSGKLRHVHQNTFNSEIHGNTMEIVVSPLVKKFLSIKAIKEDKHYHHCNLLVS